MFKFAPYEILIPSFPKFRNLLKQKSTASNFRAPAIFLVFALHAYFLTSPGGKSPEQDLYSLRDYRFLRL